MMNSGGSDLVLFGVVVFVAFSLVYIVLVCFEVNFTTKNCKTWHQRRYPEFYGVDIAVEDVPFSDGEKHRLRREARDGRLKMKSKTVVICGLCRNIGIKLPMMRKRLEHTGEMFKNYHIVLFENDSEDDTRKQIENWVLENNSVHLIACPEDEKCRLNVKKLYDVGSLSETRITKMAGFRNRYLQVVKQKFASSCDIMMVVDMDISGAWCNDALAANFCDQRISTWDAVFANGRMPIVGTFGEATFMYDGLAFQAHEAECPKDEHLPKTQTHRNLHIAQKLINFNLTGRRHIATDELSPILTCSAFNGIGVYKMYAIDCSDDVKYGGTYCEHLYLHNQMCKHGFNRLFIDPAFLLFVGYQGSVFQCRPTVISNV